MKKDFVTFFNEFHVRGKLTDNPVELGEFWPISLIGSIYKILSKVLAARLKRVMPGLIGEVQSAFIGRRNIFNGILIANEIVNWWKRKKM